MNEPQVQTNEPQVQTDQTIVDNIKYPEGFDETLKGHGSVKKFVDKEGNINYANVLKSYVNAENIIGKSKVPIPDKNFTDANWNEFYDKIGRPSLEEYNIENKVPKGLNANEEVFKNFKEKAHSLGLLPKQAQGVSDFYNELLKDTMQKNEAEDEQRIVKEREALHKEWGNAFDKNIKLAESGLKQFASDEEIKELSELGFMNNIAVTKLFAKIGGGLSEDTFTGQAKGNFGMSPDEAREKIRSYYDADHPYMNKMHPQNAYYRQEMVKLHEIAGSSIK